MLIERLRRVLHPGRKVVPVVRLSGVIGGIGPLHRGFGLAEAAAPLDRAFAFPGAVAVALIVNSPGGSPVQSSLIGNRIRALALEHNVRVIAFVEDVAASGGYWIACAADEIYADPSSIVGSIGVISAGFGLPELLARHGIERRVHTAGERKNMLDPFLPETPEDVRHLKSIHADIHAAFRAWVAARRGERIDGKAEDLYSGAFWTGPRALELGLIDGLGDLRTVLRARFGDTVRTPLIGARRSWWRRLPLGQSGLPDDLPNDLPGGLLAAIEERLLWQRFGL